jgi:hypothetical protein
MVAFPWWYNCRQRCCEGLSEGSMKTYTTIAVIDARFVEIKEALKGKVSDTKYRDLTSEAVYLKDLKTKMEQNIQK